MRHQEQLKIALVQTSIHWMNPTANMAELEEKLSEIEDENVDLVVFPELFTTGFHPSAAELSEPIGLTTTKWMLQQAKRLDAAIIGSYPVRQDRQIFNRLLFVKPDGTLSHYDKRHLFKMGSEHMTFSPGNFQLIEEWKGWRINPIICYDLRFPLWCRNTNNDYDILLCIGNWPKARISAWQTLLNARGLENLSFSIGVNRVGADQNGIDYNGFSVAYTPKGELLNVPNEEDEIKIVTLDYNEVQSIREKFPAHLDADHFNLHL
ncbi:amidohydrolase [Flammeovirga kamogawensis]|uniref:Amidohydrolase n=1 Tax=Flammeovirga kamogawensis TaxID=373891 RepID=A0ABX8GW95_9BACT|nr:amidohydrolase [Flammeovirga kamogawensis]MBB6461102.1 putative amidohydrolase [Flammeovirga kamogawensis]QWG07668.1 amidohydrolase [Flammeovirga kamogawensis]TRX69478.1 amidohydrolase [Flammeovirga kamogawensis]